MAVKAIAHSYWRSIKRGARTFDGVLDPVKEDVRTLARADVADGIITQEEYQPVSYTHLTLPTTSRV